MARVSELLSLARLVTLIGPPGIGKTRLALEVALARRPDYRDGVWLVDLSSLIDPIHVPHAIASVLGVKEGPGGQVNEAVVSTLEDSHLLLVLDSCEHLVGATSEITQRILEYCSGVTVLASSQMSLGLLGERIVEVAPLDIPDKRVEAGEDLPDSPSVRLFIDRAKEVMPDFDWNSATAPAVTEICQRLDGVPLAIEMAAARTSVLSLDEILEQLDSRFTILYARKGSATRPHHRTLRTTLDWSCRLLSEEEKSLLRRISQFPDGATLDAVEQVCFDKPSAHSALRLLDALVSRSLVICQRESESPTRYRLLETVRHYGREKLSESGDEQVVAARFARWCVGFVGKPVPNDPEGLAGWFKRVENEYHNIRGALSWAVSAKEVALGFKLGAALVPFWRDRGYLTEGREWLRRLLGIDEGRSHPLAGQMLLGAAVLAAVANDLEEAAWLAREARDFFESRGDIVNRIRADHVGGFLGIFSLGPRKAMVLLEGCVNEARENGDSGLLPRSLANLGRAYLFGGYGKPASSVYSEAIDVARAAKDRVMEADVMLGMGWAALLQGHANRALALLEEGLRLSEMCGLGYNAALGVVLLGEASEMAGDRDRGEFLFRRCLELTTPAAAPFPRARALIGLAGVAIERADAEAALRHQMEASKVLQKGGQQQLLSYNLLAEGNALKLTGEVGAAHACFEEALSAARAKGDEHAVGNALSALADSYREAGDLRSAVSVHHEALSLRVSLGNSAGGADSLEALGSLEIQRGRHARAVRLLAASATLRRATGYVRRLARGARYRADLRAARDCLTPAIFALAWKEGGSLSLEEAGSYVSRGRGSRDRPEDGWDSLTPAEREVAKLARERLSNIEIAERLFISPRTVQSHLTHVFAKLGIPSRKALVAPGRQEGRTKAKQQD